MESRKSEAHGSSELFEMLALMMVGACFWFIGAALGLFDRLAHFAAEHDLMSFVMLSGCVGMGAIAAMVRTSTQLRRAVLARMQAEANAERSARHDALTGLANRRLFNELLEAKLAALQPGESFAVMLIDLDRFKPINDIHGHAAGNAVLCAVAERLLKVAPRGSVVSRLGGDEFVVLLNSPTDDESLSRVAQQTIDSLRRRIAWNQGHLEVDATIGLALATPEMTDPEALLHAADVAMYQGKREGRGNYRFFHAEMDFALKARARMELDLRAAISAGAIQPHYQPIVTLPERRLVGFEVLARWDHHIKGPIEPQEFIPIAEECGMISELFYHVLRIACTEARDWPGHLHLALNVSPHQLQDPRMPEKILAVLTQTRFPANRLEIEITETALICDIGAARVALMSLQNLGVRIALDDFGTGYSTLYHLSELRFNKLKIDRSYVTSLEPGSERAKLVDAIIQLGSSLSVQTIAEGIETDANLNWLSGQGCTFGQGYLFGRAMPRSEAEAFILRDDADVSIPVVKVAQTVLEERKVTLVRAHG